MPYGGSSLIKGKNTLHVGALAPFRVKIVGIESGPTQTSPHRAHSSGDGRRCADAPHKKSDSAACTAILRDRKSTRLNSSHTVISYAVFCLKKKNPFVFDE